MLVLNSRFNFLIRLMLKLSQTSMREYVRDFTSVD